MDKLLISHRGNLFGSNPERENTLSYITEALNLGFHVEVDVWLLNNKYYLGHDRPEFIVDYDLFTNPYIWSHCKNINALEVLSLEPRANCFSHNNDDYILTSQNYIWHFPKLQPLTTNSIAVLPEKVKHWDLKNCFGICTDYVVYFKDKLKKEI